MYEHIMYKYGGSVRFWLYTYEGNSAFFLSFIVLALKRQGFQPICCYDLGGFGKSMT